MERPIELDLDSIKAMRSTTFTAVVECAGNGRVFYEPAREGLQWQSGAVGNAAWSGVLLPTSWPGRASGRRRGADRGAIGVSSTAARRLPRLVRSPSPVRRSKRHGRTERSSPMR